VSLAGWVVRGSRRIPISDADQTALTGSVGAASEKKEASVGDYHGLPSGGLWRTLVEATGRLGVMERETNAPETNRLQTCIA
jgi:hypothetical protein